VIALKPILIIFIIIRLWQISEFEIGLYTSVKVSTMLPLEQAK